MKIGGDFEYVEYKDSENNLYGYLLKNFVHIQFFFSGRSAIYSVIKNIIKESRKVDAIYLPAYSCDSIYYPVAKALESSRVKKIFYRQNEKFESTIDNVIDNSIIYVIDYFGKIDKPLLDRLREFKNEFSNIVLIRDITHSLFNEEYDSEADYYICSLRKWTFLPDGAFVASNLREIEGSLGTPENKYIQARLCASMLKRLSILYDTAIFKDECYLDIFQFCEKELNKYIDNIRISDFSLNMIDKIDYVSLLSIRKRNKEYLVGKIRKFKKFSILDTNSSVFTVPVLFNHKKDRDVFRKNLMNMKIFLPVYWPVEWQKHTNEVIYNHNKKISDRILSFVIDQRYGEKEMNYIISAVETTLKKVK